TGMVGIARGIAAARSVDGPAVVDLEHVAGAAGLKALRSLMVDTASLVLDDQRAAPDHRRGEQAKPRARASDAIGFARHRPYAACSVGARVTLTWVSTGTGSRSVEMPGQPSKESRSTSRSFSSGASLTTLIAIVTFWKPDLGASTIMCPRASKFVRA